MPPAKFSSEMQTFIFEHVDSIGFLEALLFLHTSETKTWTTAALSKELRGSTTSTTQYLSKMEMIGVVHRNGDSFEFVDSNSSVSKILDELIEAYRVHRQNLFEQIYSPLKRARDFSKAFLLSKDEGKKEDGDG